jgi:PKD repeat protein
VLAFAAVGFITACSETDPLPMPQAGFDVLNANNLEKHVPVQFINNSINAAEFKWDFGDGAFDSLNVAPEHIYTEDGTYDVTLTAVTEDGQTSSETKSITVKSRVLVAFSVANIDFLNRDLDPPAPWDDDDTGPDLIFIFGAQSAPIEDIIFTDTIQNLTQEDLPLDWEFPQGQGLELTNELHDLVLLDADPEKQEDPKYDVMFGIELNPITYPFSIKGDQDNGLLQVSIGGFAIDLYMSFELQ